MSGFRLLKAWKKGKLYFGRYAVFVEDVTVEAQPSRASRGCGSHTPHRNLPGSNRRPEDG